MQYDPQIHHRKSIRLKNYDYSRAGAYFITICTQHRVCLLGDVKDGKMNLNAAGKMVAKWYLELMNKFPDIWCDEYVIMPNHIHFIVVNVGADLRVCPGHKLGESAAGESAAGEHAAGEHAGSPLHRVVQWFKTMTTNEYIRGVKNLGWRPFDGKFWQRNYYEHIIRNETEYTNIRNYILANPSNWPTDKNYKT